jgi:sulfite exporter TauE/SafE
MTSWIPIVSGLVAGAASAPHCLAMCGPLAAFAAGDVEASARARIARHQLGRLVAYAVLGAIAGGSGAAVVGALAPASVSLVLGGLLALGMLAAAVRLVRRPRAERPVVLRRSRPRTPLAARVIGRLPREPMLIGALSAILPCGALYSALLIAASAGSIGAGAAAMASFALASGVGLLAAGWMAERATSELGRRGIAALLVLGAVIVVARPIGQALSPDASPVCHCAH